MEAALVDRQRVRSFQGLHVLWTQELDEPLDGRLEEDDVVSGGDDVDGQHRLVNVDQKLDVVEAKLAWAIPGEEKWDIILSP